MKKTIFVALAAVSMIFASCGKKMSPEATKAWEDMKAKAASVCSMEAIDQFETVEDWNAAVKAFQAATQEMGKYQSEYSKEIVDSFTTLTNKFAEVNEKAAAEEKPKTQWSKYVTMTTSPVMISNSGSDERGKYKGGQAGDQTGNEWRIRDWYNRPWNCVLRHPLAEVRACLATQAVKAAENDNVGYDQLQRDDYGIELAKADRSYDLVQTLSAGVNNHCSVLAGLRFLPAADRFFRSDSHFPFSAFGCLHQWFGEFYLISLSRHKALRLLKLIIRIKIDGYPIPGYGCRDFIL